MGLVKRVRRSRLNKKFSLGSEVSSSIHKQPRLVLVLVIIGLFTVVPEPLVIAAGRPFPQHTVYVNTSIKPSIISQSALDDSVRSFYDRWKAGYLIEGCSPNQHYIFGGTAVSNRICVSEGQGYGMLIAAFMAGHDPDARLFFDGMYNYYRAHPSQNNHDLMAWKQLAGCQSSADSSSASDGDLDIAYALLLADKQWGTGGPINYYEAALRIINAILQDEINPSTSTVKFGDWVTPSGVMYNDTRSSDFMVDHFRAFGLTTGDPTWEVVLDRSYSLIDRMQRLYSPQTGLIPDFIRHVNTTAVPAAPFFLESAYDGHYFYNACRDPFRLAVDYLLTGEPRSYDALQKINTFIRSKTGNNAGNIRAGYKLNGATIDSTDISMAFNAPLAVSAMIDPTNQLWLNRLWTNLETTNFESNDYYGNTLKMLAMIVISGNWWNPGMEQHVSFSGYEWSVKTSTSLVGPGPNYFSDGSNNVWVDPDDRLHLKITHVDGQWHCSEVTLTPQLGNGRYVFRLDASAGTLDQNEVLGLFTWDDAPQEDHREIDIEFSRWGNGADSTSAQFVVQPYSTTGNLMRWSTITPDPLTASFNWQSNSIDFLSVQGHRSYPPYNGSVISSWDYTGQNIPTPGDEHVHINFWLMDGLAPSDSLEAEVIIAKFEFNPKPSIPAAPVLIDPPINSVSQSVAIMLFWESVVEDTSYDLQVATDTSFNALIVNDSSLTDTSRQIGVTNSATYFWHIRARSAGGTSPWSAIWRFAYSNPARWKLISVPLKVNDPSKHKLYPKAISSAFTYMDPIGYIMKDSLSNGVGYWLKFGLDQTSNFEGDSVFTDTIEVHPGWNLLGSISSPVPVGSIVSLPAGINVSELYGFNDAYTKSDTILPGKGYWVKSSEPGAFILDAHASPSSPPGTRIKIVPTAELPPMPPGDGVSDFGSITPKRFALLQNYPDPFNPLATIEYDLPEQIHVLLRVFNVLGEEIKVLVDQLQSAGYQSVTFEANNLPSGIYFYRLQAGSFSDAKKMVLLK